MKMVVAVQFCHKDAARAEELVGLLVDLEQSARGDVALLFACTSEDHAEPVLERMRKRCAGKFGVGTCVVGPDTEERRRHWSGVDKWTTGSSLIWKGVVEHFLGEVDESWTTLFTVDGGDSAPTRMDWADVIMAAHGRTLASGKRVTGMVREGTWGRWHINGNMVVERSFLLDHLGDLKIPDDEDGWDGYNANMFLAEAVDSSVIRCDWDLVGATARRFADVAASSAWWHGSKDKYFVNLAREQIEKNPLPLISVSGTGPADRYLVGGNPRRNKNFPVGGRF